MNKAINTFNSLSEIKIGNNKYHLFSLAKAEQNGLNSLSALPYSIKILIENLLRNEDGFNVKHDDIVECSNWPNHNNASKEIFYNPTRVIMQDFTGVPVIVNLASMRDAAELLNKDPAIINPINPVDLIIDHSVAVDYFGDKHAVKKNMEVEFKKNQERYNFLKWAQNNFNNLRIVPPGKGICHQINIEYLAKVVTEFTKGNQKMLYPDTVIGTDSHTTMVNGIGVLGWGVGGIEAASCMLGQPISMLLPEVIGVKLTGNLHKAVTTTDLVLHITEILRKKGVTSKFVEFFGPSLQHLSVPDRATIANMAPEYGATCGLFPIDQKTLDYLYLTGRNEEQITVVEHYAKYQNMWHDPLSTQHYYYHDVVEIKINEVEPCLAGPKRPQDKVLLSQIADTFKEIYKKDLSATENNKSEDTKQKLQNGDVVLAAITSCTNTSNPNVLIAAGLLAKKACDKGLVKFPFVKGSLAPGSLVVQQYLEQSGLQKYLDQLGFNVVGFGCTTCIGNSGALDPKIEQEISNRNLIVSSVLSGNRNFEGRIHQHIKANWLGSPPLVVAYSIFGTTNKDISKEPLGHDQNGTPVYLQDIWPSQEEINQYISRFVTREVFQEKYNNIWEGTADWNKIKISKSLKYPWDKNSTYIQHPPYFSNINQKRNNIQDIKQANILLLLGDSVTTDHISPAGAIQKNSPAGKFLIEHNVQPADFNSYGSRRGNHKVMMRGTFANIRIKNEMLPGTEGGVTLHLPDKQITSVYDAAMKYKFANTPLVVIAGKEYGTGSSRDWAAIGTNLLGVKAVIAESFERIHCSNLIGMGVLPLTFTDNTNRKTLNITRAELISIYGLTDIEPNKKLIMEIKYINNKIITTEVCCMIKTETEMEYYKKGSILNYALLKN